MSELRYNKVQIASYEDIVPYYYYLESSKTMLMDIISQLMRKVDWLE